MSEKYKLLHSQGLHFLTCTVAGWLDVFTRNTYRQIVIDSLAFCREHKGLHLNAFVLLTNHLHLVARTDPPFILSEVLRDFKKFTGNNILAALDDPAESRREWMLRQFEYFGRYKTNREKFQFWQDGNHPIGLWSDAVIQQKIQYIHQNPVRAGFVAHPTDWWWSSAFQYWNGATTALEVEVLWPESIF
jgi:putative transposase